MAHRVGFSPGTKRQSEDNVPEKQVLFCRRSHIHIVVNGGVFFLGALQNYLTKETGLCPDALPILILVNGG